MSSVSIACPGNCSYGSCQEESEVYKQFDNLNPSPNNKNESNVYEWFQPPSNTDHFEERRNKYDSYSIYSDGHVFEFVPSSCIPGNYRNSIRGVAFLDENKALINIDQDEFGKRVTMEHEKIHLEGETDELQTRAKTVDNLKAKGMYVEAQIAEEQFRNFQRLGIYSYS